MSIKTYDLTEAERRELFEILEASLQRRNPRLSVMRRSYFRDLFSNEHPVDPEIVGRRALLDYMHERGFKGRELEALMQYTWGPGDPTWLSIMTGLNAPTVVDMILRAPNIGTLTARSTLQRCIAHGWIRSTAARKSVDRYLTETAPKPKAKDNG